MCQSLLGHITYFTICRSFLSSFFLIYPMGSLPNVIYPDIKINSFTSLPNNDTSWILDFLKQMHFLFFHKRVLKDCSRQHNRFIKTLGSHVEVSFGNGVCGISNRPLVSRDTTPDTRSLGKVWQTLKHLISVYSLEHSIQFKNQNGEEWGKKVIFEQAHQCYSLKCQRLVTISSNQQWSNRTSMMSNVEGVGGLLNHSST